MRIGELAEHLGVATHVLRHWEDVGVLVPDRGPGGHRDYDPGAVVDGRLVQLCQRSGLSLAQIRVLLDTDPVDRRPLIEAHRARIAVDLARLQRTDAFLEHVLSCRHPVVSECPDCTAYAAG